MEGERHLTGATDTLNPKLMRDTEPDVGEQR